MGNADARNFVELDVTPLLTRGPMHLSFDRFCFHAREPAVRVHAGNVDIQPDLPYSYHPNILEVFFEHVAKFGPPFRSLLLAWPVPIFFRCEPIEKFVELALFYVC